MYVVKHDAQTRRYDTATDRCGRADVARTPMAAETRGRADVSADPWIRGARTRGRAARPRRPGGLPATAWLACFFQGVADPALGDAMLSANNFSESDWLPSWMSRFSNTYSTMCVGATLVAAGAGVNKNTKTPLRFEGVENQENAPAPAPARPQKYTSKGHRMTWHIVETKKFLAKEPMPCLSSYALTSVALKAGRRAGRRRALGAVPRGGAARGSGYDTHSMRYLYGDSMTMISPTVISATSLILFSYLCLTNTYMYIARGVTFNVCVFGNYTW